MFLLIALLLLQVPLPPLPLALTPFPLPLLLVLLVLLVQPDLLNQQSRLDQDQNMNHRAKIGGRHLNNHTFHLDHDHQHLPITITKFIILPVIRPIIIGNNNY
uniref:Uncharacterized protein n=2 Tax=Picea TaxID=3328 RepID=A0A101LVI1_PICGL|nr:hypothetical protein ABT39_MTgene1935 [Picea glauca]QHR89920.1 hypothetical protein Q903MT_gene3942 [Picea sitchensis]